MINDQLNIQAASWLDEQVAEAIYKIEQTNEGRSFLRDHDEIILRYSIAFLQNPIEYYELIKDIGNICDYLWAYQVYLFGQRDEDRDDTLNDFFRFLECFKPIDDIKAEILSHLMLVCNTALFAEAISDLYIRLFENSPDIFISSLRREKSWKTIVNRLRVGDWNAFKAGISKLGSSKFERELKAYVSDVERRIE